MQRFLELEVDENGEEKTTVLEEKDNYKLFSSARFNLKVMENKKGDPDKADLLAAARGHKHIVTFLVNFGANIYSTDIDGRTAQELAGMNNRDDILRFLDGVHAKLEAGDKKKAKARPRRFTFNKRQVKKEQVQEKLEKRMNKGHHRPSMIETLKTRIKSGSIWGRPLRGSAPSWDAEFGVGAEAGARRRLQGAPESK
nr:PREDICTED: Usher syndrome type-1G protein homolog [Tribolium castaneum]|eukprot:XP_015839541.1 PREDICTED: Usher syndrome type-1G protein homolog [Tribolium castaneum]